jgi:transcriptional regulator with XRE-family HTH domain
MVQGRAPKSVANRKTSARVDRWRKILSDARQAVSLSRQDLADRAGVSVETVRGYENGRRHPKQDSLEAILNALHLERVQANAVREGAGFAPVRSLFSDDPHYFYSTSELQQAVEEVEWPQFVSNDSFEVVAANALMCRLWGLQAFSVERQRRTSTELNIMMLASELKFAERVQNWDELLMMIAGRIKGTPALPQEISDPGPYLALVAGTLAEQDPPQLFRMIDAWGRAEPISPKVRWDYRVIWNAPPAGHMVFHAVVSTASERNGLSFNDWMPIGQETWKRLEKLKSG